MKLIIALLVSLLTGCGPGNLKFSAPSSITTDPPYTLNGSLIASFGTGGLQTLAGPHAQASGNYAQAAVERSDGSTYFSAYYNNGTGGYRSYLYKVNTDTGSVDPTFGIAGQVDISSAGLAANERSLMYKMKLVSDRYLLICGTENPGGNYDGIVKLYDLSTSSFVNTFGTGGVVRFESTDLVMTSSIVSNCEYDEYENKIVITGRRVKNDFTVQEAYVGRIDLTGTLDAAFNGGSLLQLTHADFDLLPVAMSVYITSTAYYFFVNEFDYNFTISTTHLAKVSKAGVLDLSFVNAGIYSFDPLLSVYDFVEDSTNNLIILLNDDVNGGKIKVSKFNTATGVLDLSFGAAGYLDLEPILEAVLGPLTPGASKLTKDEEGNFIISWHTTSGNNISSFNSLFTLNSDFGTSGILSLPISAGSDTAWTGILYQENDGELFVAGSCNKNDYSVSTPCMWKVD